MSEFRGLVASATKNENHGFVTPQNKNILSRKTLFTDKPKIAFGDLKKNVSNVITPMKNGAIEKKPQQSPLLPSASINESPTVFDETTNSTPKANTFDYKMDEMDIWNQKQTLSVNQFDFLFINPPMMSPPRPESPPPMMSPPRPESPPLSQKFPEYWSDDGNFNAVWQYDDLPSINVSFTSDDDHVDN